VWLPCVVILAGLYAASARYALMVSFGQKVAIGIVAGAAECHIRDLRSPTAPPPPLRPGMLAIRSPAPAQVEHDPVYFFRHRFTFLWTPRYRESSLLDDQWVEVPLWMPLAPLVALGAWPWLWRRIRTRRGQCRQCGYDLRSCTGPVCPECGSAGQGCAESTR
jgi:hypothetical protein